MKKILVFLLIIVLAPLIGGIYGILHDQFTYTISPEYYTKFKFYQFGLAYTGNEAIFPNPRVQVCIVGFRATWWMGLPIGIILGITGLFHKGHKHCSCLYYRIDRLAVRQLSPCRNRCELVAAG
jgi:ABC-type antimicrobial peptide transport system permease subunit